MIGTPRGKYVLPPRIETEYRILLQDTNRQISSWGNYLLARLPLLEEKQAVDVVVVSNLDLGFTEEWVEKKERLPNYRDTQQWAQRIGLKIPPIHLALECCIQGFEQSAGENITVCSQPLPDSCETIKQATFAVDRDAKSYWLLGTPARAISQRSLQSLFMFIR